MMIERYLFFKLTDDHANEAGREEVARRTLEVLPRIPGVTGVTVGRPADEDSRAAWDVSVTVRFARIEDVQPYADHPEHRRYVDEFLKPRLLVIKAWNFDVETA